MRYRTYLDKFCTIVKGSNLNTGINQIAQLVYGVSTSRLLIHFDINKIEEFIADKTFANISKLHHILHITNAGSLDFSQMNMISPSDINGGSKKRASSFDLIFFKVPVLWDNGKGYDYSYNAFNNGYKTFNDISSHNPSTVVSTDGCTWYQPRNGYSWDDNGIYSNDFLSKEYDKFSSDEGSDVIFARQHFDIGNENISIDVTDLVNQYLSGETNYGIGIAFSPELENLNKNVSNYAQEKKLENYIGFLTDKTNSFFEPFLETIYDEHVDDDRGSFYLNKVNRLYLYCSIGDSLENLDVMPTCSIQDSNEEEILSGLEVNQCSKGIYYVDVQPNALLKSNLMYYDIWSNIVYNSVQLDDVELNFVPKSSNKYFSIGNSIKETPQFVPSVFGINNNESILRGDIRKIGVIAKTKYSSNSFQIINNIEARLYVMDGEREVDILPFEKLNKTIDESYFIIDTEMLIPQKYYIDVKISYGMESIISHNIVSFSIVDSLNNKYA